MQQRLNRILAVVTVTVAAVGLAACGGGGGGDLANAGGGGAAILLLNGLPNMGNQAMGGGVTLTPFNVLTPSAATQVGPNDFPVPAMGDFSFIQLDFSQNVAAASILDGTFSGNDGVEILDNLGNRIPFFLDANGIIDASNAFPSPGVAPATVRLYIEDPNTPGTPTAFAAGQFTINLVTSRLMSETGGPFCIFTTGNVCATNTEVVYSFTIGGDMTPIGPAANPSLPLLNSQIRIDSEIRLFFNENVDFQSLVGINPMLGTLNTTQLDQFISVPFTPGAAPTMGENLTVNYTPPAPAVLPQNYSYVVYMPDPFRNPTEVRVRFVDNTLLSAFDIPPALTQNYGLDNQVYSGAGIAVPLNSAGNPLNLPAALPLPGSDMNGTATLNVTVFGQGNPGAMPSSAADGVLGLTDRARNPMIQDVTVNYTLQMGPTIANNPSPPDLNIVANGAVLTSVSSAAVAAGAISTGSLIGNLNVSTPSIDDPTILGQVSDVGFGPFLAGNVICNPPRRAANGAAIALGIDPGAPFPPGGTPESGLLIALGQPAGPPVQPLGVRLYVVDRTANLVRTFDSTTFLPLGSLTGVPSPHGLGLLGGFMWVSNFDQATVQRIGVNPLQTATFHQVVTTAEVGQNPTAVSVQPENEDVLVVNSTENTVSFVDVASGVERVKFPVGQGPRDIFVSTRMLCMGCTFAYTAFISNFFENTITIYESDSTNPQVLNGTNGVILENRPGFQGPSNGIWNQLAVPSAFGLGGGPGCFIANSTGTSIDQLTMTNFMLAPMPGFMGPPSQRIFQTVQTITAPGQSPPSDITIEGMTRVNVMNCDLSNPTRVLIGCYPGSGNVSSIDAGTGITLGTVTAPSTQIWSILDQ